MVASEFAETATATVKNISDVSADDMILDVGPETAGQFGGEPAQERQNIPWNGPVGVFEFDQFGNGTSLCRSHRRKRRLLPRRRRRHRGCR